MSYNSWSNRARNFKSASRFALDRFRNYSRDYSLNCTPLGPITITNYQLVTSCLGIARSYKVATVGVNNKPVQTTRYRLIQPRNVSTWPILYPTLVNESPQRLTKFICGFRKCHSVCSNIWEVPFATTLLILMPLTRKCFG